MPGARVFEASPGFLRVSRWRRGGKTLFRSEGQDRHWGRCTQAYPSPAIADRKRNSGAATQCCPKTTGRFSSRGVTVLLEPNFSIVGSGSAQLAKPFLAKASYPFYRGMVLARPRDEDWRFETL